MRPDHHRRANSAGIGILLIISGVQMIVFHYSQSRQDSYANATYSIAFDKAERALVRELAESTASKSTVTALSKSLGEVRDWKRDAIRELDRVGSLTDRTASDVSLTREQIVELRHMILYIDPAIVERMEADKAVNRLNSKLKQRASSK